MKSCYFCSKSRIITGRRKLLRGHYNPTATVVKYPNLHWFKLGAGRKRVRVCTNCLRKKAKE